MKHLSLTFVIMMAPVAGFAETQNAVITNIIDGHILPRFETLAASTLSLSDAAQADCDPSSDSLRAA